MDLYVSILRLKLVFLVCIYLPKCKQFLHCLVPSLMPVKDGILGFTLDASEQGQYLRPFALYLVCRTWFFYRVAPELIVFQVIQVSRKPNGQFAICLSRTILVFQIQLHQSSIFEVDLVDAVLGGSHLSTRL